MKYRHDIHGGHMHLQPFGLYTKTWQILLVGVTVNIPLIFFGAHYQVLSALLQVQSLSASSMRHEGPRLANFKSSLHTWPGGGNIELSDELRKPGQK